MNPKQIAVKSKLFKLKEWLTLPDATKHLSLIFGENVNKADVLRLALDKHLVLSVYFVNHAYAKRGKVVSSEEAEWYPPNFLSEMFAKELKGRPLRKSLPIDENRFINLEEDVRILEGVWNLSMIGNEQLDLEHEFQMLTGGPEVTLTGMDGSFVEREDGVIWQLQESYDQNEFQPGSTAAFEKLKERIANNNIGEVEAKKLFDEHKNNRKEYLDTRSKKKWSDDYFPAGGLPRDSILVVRTQALIDLQESLSYAESSEKSDFISINYNPFFNMGHSFYANELRIAVEAWTELYEKNPPQHVPPGGHKKYINKWLEGKYPELGKRALERIATIINPNPKGGASPMK